MRITGYHAPNGRFSSEPESLPVCDCPVPKPTSQLGQCECGMLVATFVAPHLRYRFAAAFPVQFRRAVDAGVEPDPRPA